MNENSGGVAYIFEQVLESSKYSEPSASTKSFINIY